MSPDLPPRDVMQQFSIIPNEQTPVAPEIDLKELKESEILKEELVKFLAFVTIQDNAYGVAANQLMYNGKRFNRNAFVINMKSGARLVINPKITAYKGFKINKKESCLTWEGKTILAKRSPAIDVEFYDIDGCKFNWKLHGLYAQIFQHETDHLNGIQETFLN